MLTNNRSEGSINVDGNNSDEEHDLSIQNRYWPPPIKDILELNGCLEKKTVCAATFNNEATKVATGGNDCNVSIFDLSSLSKTCSQPTHTVQPCGSHIVKTLDFSHDDKWILVISGSSQAKIISSSDGGSSNELQCPQGYQYIRDLSKTKGHAQMLNDGSWNRRSTEFITCSNDCTVRIWCMENMSNNEKQIIKAKSPKNGLPVVPTVCRYSRDNGISIVAGCKDGSVLMWDTRRKFITTSACIKNAHKDKFEISGLDFAYGSTLKLVTRSCDGSCKLWDMRNLKQPTASNLNLISDHPSTDVQFSPDDKSIITGLIADNDSDGGLAFLDGETLELKHETLEKTTIGGVVKCQWHARANQIVVGTTDGRVKIFHDPLRSHSGAKLSSSTRVIKISTKHAGSYSRHQEVIVGATSGRSLAMKERLDPVKSMRPELPLDGRGRQGRLAAAGSTLSSYIAKNLARPRPDDGLDVRQKILKHAEASK